MLPVTSFFGFVYLRSLETLVFCFFSIETFAAALVRAFSSHCTLLIWWAGPTHIDKRCVSGCIFAYISMTTQARNFKFAGTPVQKLHLAMVALTQKIFSAHYAWYSHGGSHYCVNKAISERKGTIKYTKFDQVPMLQDLWTQSSYRLQKYFYNLDFTILCFVKVILSILFNPVLLPLYFLQVDVLHVYLGTRRKSRAFVFNHWFPSSLQVMAHPLVVKIT